MTRTRGRRWMAVRARVLRRDGGVCHWCAGPADHVDHLLPLALGGTDDDGNLVAACASCNLGRGARTGPPPGLAARRSGW